MLLCYVYGNVMVVCIEQMSEMAVLHFQKSISNDIPTLVNTIFFHASHVGCTGKY